VSNVNFWDELEYAGGLALDDAVSEHEFMTETQGFSFAIRTAELFPLKGPAGKGVSIWHRGNFHRKRLP